MSKDIPILFININTPSNITSFQSIPISLGYVAAYLKINGFDSYILDDLEDKTLRLGELKQFILEHHPILVGFSAYQANIERIRLYAKYIKSIDSKIRVIIGGPQATFMPTDGLLDLKYVDIICRSEGEGVMLDVVRSLCNNDSLSKVQGISYVEGDVLYDTELSKGFEDLDKYPSPYLLDIIDLSQKEAAMVITSRGCVYHCIFCYTPRASHFKIRFYSIERVMDEIRHCIEKGITRFWFADPNFSFSPKRIERLMDQILTENLKISFWCQTRYDLVNESLLRKMKRAGAATIAYGLESASKPILKGTKKNLDVERLPQVVKLTQSLGIDVELFSIYGLPGETLDDARKTLNFVKGHGIVMEGNAGSQQLEIYFGTELHQNYASYGIIPTKSHKPRYLSIGTDFETTTLSSKDIAKIKAIWLMNTSHFQEEFASKRDVFALLSFLVHYSSYLKGEYEYYFYLTELLKEMEEYDLIYQSLKSCRDDASLHNNWLNDFIRQLTFYQEIRDRIDYGFKVLFDCSGYIGGQLVGSASGHFQSLTIGSGAFIPEFEEELLSLREGEEKTFNIRFPEDYFDKNLRECDVLFQVKVHKAYKPVFVNDIEEIPKLGIRNDYSSLNLASFKEKRPVLYFLYLKSLDKKHLMKKPDLLLDLIDRYLEVGKINQALTLSNHFSGNGNFKTGLAHIFKKHKLCKVALELYSGGESKGYEIKLGEAICYFHLKHYNQSLKILHEIYNENDIRFLYYLQEIHRIKNEVEKMKELREKILDLKIQILLSKEGPNKQKVLKKLL